MTKFCSNISISGVIYRPLEVKIHPKVGLSRSKTMPKRFLKELWKSSENDSFDPQNGQKWPLKTAKMSKFLIENFNFRGHLSTFWAEIQPKVGLLRPKTMLKQFLNNSQSTLKKSRKRLFRPPKLPKMTPQIGQNEQIFDRKFRFSRSFIDL